MQKLPIVIGLFATLAVPGFAADDPVAIRQTLMDSNGGAAAVAGGMLKGEIAYNPAVAKSVILSWHAVAESFGSFLPEGSADPARSHASPKIWEDKAAFEKELGEFREATEAALKAAGKDGPADKAAFQAAAGPVLDTCKDCHEDFRTKDK